jgi:hypothetical protein
MELFDYLNAMTEKKEELDFNNPEISSKYQPYMINRFVSMSEVFLPFVNEINKYQVPKEIHYKYLFSILPKRKQFFKYIKSTKDLSLQEKKILANYFNIGMKEAEEYIQILDDSQIKEILEIYRCGKNTIIEL